MAPAEPQPKPPSKPPSRRRRSRVGHVYPQAAAVEWHAKALLDHIVAGSPDLIGSFIPHQQLDTLYRSDVCTKRKWTPHKWDAIGRELAKLDGEAHHQEGWQALRWLLGSEAVSGRKSYAWVEDEDGVKHRLRVYRVPSVWCVHNVCTGHIPLAPSFSVNLLK